MMAFTQKGKNREAVIIDFNKLIETMKKKGSKTMLPFILELESNDTKKKFLSEYKASYKAGAKTTEFQVTVYWFNDAEKEFHRQNALDFAIKMGKGFGSMMATCENLRNGLIVKKDGKFVTEKDFLKAGSLIKGVLERCCIEVKSSFFEHRLEKIYQKAHAKSKVASEFSDKCFTAFMEGLLN